MSHTDHYKCDACGVDATPLPDTWARVTRSSDDFGITALTRLIDPAQKRATAPGSKPVTIRADICEACLEQLLGLRIVQPKS